jgi:hypothetical protein
VTIGIAHHEAAIPVGVDVHPRRHRDALRRQVVAQRARIRGLEPDADQPILRIFLQRRRHLDELPVVHLEARQLARDLRVVRLERLRHPHHAAVELPRFFQAGHLYGDIRDSDDLRPLRRAQPDGKHRGDPP